MTENKRIMRDAREFIAENFFDMCEEYIEYGATGILKNGKIRELIDIIRPVAEYSAQDLAIKMLEQKAVEYSVAGKVK